MKEINFIEVQNKNNKDNIQFIAEILAENIKVLFSTDPSQNVILKFKGVEIVYLHASMSLSLETDINNKMVFDLIIEKLSLLLSPRHNCKVSFDVTTPANSKVIRRIIWLNKNDKSFFGNLSNVIYVPGEEIDNFDFYGDESFEQLVKSTEKSNVIPFSSFKR